jgi:AcrR family transcriptional regulator
MAVMGKAAAKKRVQRHPPANRYEGRRSELVGAALKTLGELGYARTSLREIAQKSRFSHGVIHYYFSDKIDLIAYCVRDYKAQCVKRYEEITIDATNYEALAERFSQGLCDTLSSEATLHRLWYDLRAQALYEERFRNDVNEIDKSLEDMIWRIVSKALELRGHQPRFSPAVAYATFDGLFQNALLRYLADDPEALPELKTKSRDFLDRIT